MTRRPQPNLLAAAVGGLLAVGLAMSGPTLAADGALSANRVLGQPDFASSECLNPPTAASLCSPSSMVVGPSGRLFIADSDNNRVLSWPDVATLTDGQDSDLVLGQSDFGTDACASDSPPSQSLLCNPSSLALDPAGRLFVADEDNNRVLIWNKIDGLVNGQPADLVLGQKDFTTKKCPDKLTAASMCGPAGLALGPDNRLFVSDTDSNRVLMWSNRVALANGQPADLVLGQQDFKSDECLDIVTASGLCSPSALLVAPNGRLLVADSDNSRVMSWPDVTLLKNGQAADLVLGQADFSTSDCNDPPIAQNICSPSGFAITPSGRLLVADFDNNRVLSWPSFKDLRSGQTPDRVIGQASFTTNECPEPGDGSTLCGPNELMMDSTGALWLADTNKNRVLRFPPPAP